MGIELSDYERGWIDAESWRYLDEFRGQLKDGYHDCWYGFMVKDRMFDINIWYDDTRRTIWGILYECQRLKSGDWETVKFDFETLWGVDK